MCFGFKSIVLINLNIFPTNCCLFESYIPTTFKICKTHSSVIPLENSNKLSKPVTCFMKSLMFQEDHTRLVYEAIIFFINLTINGCSS